MDPSPTAIVPRSENFARYAQVEQALGIQQFATPASPILALTKYLLTDFIVNEIGMDGQVVKLKHPPTAKPIEPVQPVSFHISAQFLADITTALGSEAARAIEILYERAQKGQKIAEWNHVLPYRAGREDRMVVHNFVREHLNYIESTTLENEKGLLLKWNKKLKKTQPALRHKYLHFVLWKTNLDTNGAIYKLSKITGINMKLFSTAGLKDKRGVTTQLASVYNTDSKLLAKFYSHYDRNRDLYIDQFEPGKNEPVSVGSLIGNQFGLVLRLLSPSDAELFPPRVEAMRSIGFVNYFGLQRFGTCGTKSHLVGVQVLKRQWKELVEGLLFANGDPHNTRELYDKGLYDQAERTLNNKFKVEKIVFKSLARNGANYSNVFESLPRSLKTIYTHALQSYLWNRVVSRRLREHGLTLKIGDLVAVQSRPILPPVPLMEPEEALHEQEDVLETEQILTVLINSENMKEFSIQDLVAPLYGPEADVPKESILLPYIEDELASLGLTHEDFLGNARLHCIQGRFRKMFVKPMQIDCKIIAHGHFKEELQSSDYVCGQEVEVLPGELRSAQIILQLPKSCYATMALRELLHSSSEFGQQMELSRIYEATHQQAYIVGKEDAVRN